MISTNKINVNSTEFILMSLISLTGPMTFLTLRPMVNLFFVDFFILIYGIVFFINSGCKKVSQLLLVSVFLILFGYVFSGLLSDYKDGFILSLMQYAFVFFVIVAFSTAELTSEMIEKLLLLYVIGISISILVSFFAYFNIVALPHLNYYVAGRFNGVWGNPNSLAKEMINLIMLLLSWWLLYRNPLSVKLKCFFFVMLLSALYLIMASASFGGILFLALAVIPFLIIVTVTTNSSKLILIALFVFIFYLFLETQFSLLLNILPEKFIMRILEADGVEQAGSGSEKYNQIIFGLQKFISFPFYGVGLENGKYYNEVSNVSNSHYVPFHSFYVTAMVEGGVLTVLGFMGLFSYLFFCSLKNRKFGLFFLVILITFLINLIINNNIFNRYVWFPVIFCTLSCHVQKKELYE
jgi:hypothetical protein